MKVAIYPGSFDPFTRGHNNIIERGVRVFDKVIIAVAHNTTKKTLFTLQERVDMLSELFGGREEIEVDYFEGLLVDYVQKKGTNIILRGMRTVSDFEYELRIALANKTLNQELETVFLVTDSEYAHISSSILKEVVSLGGSASLMVHELVEEKMKEKLIRG